MKEIHLITLFLIVFTVLGFSTDLGLQLVPQNVELLLILKDNSTNYELLKSVPLARMLLEDLGMELFVQQQLEIYKYSQGIDVDSFYKLFSKNILFYRSPTEEALIFGPFEDPEKIAQAVKDVLEQFDVEAEFELVDNFLAFSSSEYSRPEAPVNLPQEVKELLTQKNWMVWYMANGALGKAWGSLKISDDIVMGEGIANIENQDILEKLRTARDVEKFANIKVFKDIVFCSTVPDVILEMGDILPLPENVEEKELKKLKELNEYFKESVGRYSYASLEMNVEYTEEGEQVIKMRGCAFIDAKMDENKMKELLEKRGGKIIGKYQGKDVYLVGEKEEKSYVMYDTEKSQLIISLSPFDETFATLETSQMKLGDAMKLLSVEGKEFSLVYINFQDLMEKFLGYSEESYFILKGYQLEDGKVRMKFILK